jgi:hypothetical protein
MLETLVLGVCIQGEACDEALKMYYYHKPSIARKLKDVQKDIVFYTGDWILYAAPAAMFAVQNKPASIKFNKNLVLRINKETSIIEYNWEF